MSVVVDAARGLAVTGLDAAVAELTAIVEQRATLERELEAARAASRLHSSRFARIGEAGVLGIFIATVDRKVIEVNDTLARMLGFTREEILADGFSWFERTPADWHEPDRLAVEELARTGVTQLREKEYVHKAGHRVQVIVGSAMVETSSVECVSFVLDISTRKRAEAEAARLRAESEAAAQLAAVVDASGDAIIGLSLDGTITSWNRGAERTFGYSAAEAIGDRIRLLTPDDRAHENPAIRERLRLGEVVKADTVRVAKDGRAIDVALTVSPIRDRGGDVHAVSIVAHDITERRLAAEQLARARDEAEAASRELEAFSYSVAHDLRAPLRGINGFAKVLLDDYGDKLDADGRDCLDEVRGGAEKMASLIDALLSLSRVTRSELRRERVDLAALVTAAAVELSFADPDRRVSIVTPPTLFASLDPRLARVLVTNLVGNAWKFTRDAAGARIELGVREADGALFIRDNGAGFDMAHAGKLFAPFQRLHTVREFAGTGIGLATVQRIVHRHGGRIWAEAQVGLGASFLFVIPAESSASPAESTP